MNISRLVSTCIATLLCLSFAVPAASAVTLEDESTVVSVEGEVRTDLPKDPAALLVAPEVLPTDQMSVDGVEVTAPFTDAVAPELVVDTGNSLPISNFKDGDIILGFNKWTVGHAGILDGSRGISLSSSCVWSAVKEYPGCVTLEKPLKYRGYDWAYGLWVPKALASQRTAARRLCSAQYGERYNLLSSKTDMTQWYCSKLPWVGYRDRAAKDLDANGGYWVTPSDLYNDADTRVFASSH